MREGERKRARLRGWACLMRPFPAKEPAVPSTVSVVPLAMPSATAGGEDPLIVAPTSLAAAFAAVPDPRRAVSVAYPLPAILALAVVAILVNHYSVLAIADRSAPSWRPSAFPTTAPRANRPCSACSASLTATLWRHTSRRSRPRRHRGTDRRVWPLTTRSSAGGDAANREAAPSTR